ncbi:MAG: hypothetical protein M3M99_07180 [Actinomycetota bacterium]|nr:hypothetical protein [Actinomycetota bacterium]
MPALLEESGWTSPPRGVGGRPGIALAGAFCIVGLVACGGGERQDAGEPSGEFPVEIASAEFPAKQRLARTSELALEVRNSGDETIPDLAITVYTEGDPEAVQLSSDAAASADPAASDQAATDAEGNPIPRSELDEAVDQALQDELDQDSAADGTTSTSSDEGSTGAETTSSEEEGPIADGAFSVISEQPDLAIPSRPVWILEQGYPRTADTEAGRAPPGELSGTGGAETAQTNTFSFGPLAPNESRTVVWQVTPVQAGNYTVHYRIAAGLQGEAVAVIAGGSPAIGEFAVEISDEPPQTRVNDAGEVVPIKQSDIIGQAGSKQQKSEVGAPQG